MQTQPAIRCFHLLNAELLTHVAPICAAVGAQVKPYSSEAAETDVVLLDLESVERSAAVHRTLLVGTKDEASELYEVASGTDLKVVVLPEGAQWLAAELSRGHKQQRAYTTIFAGSTGGAGSSTAAVIAAHQSAHRGGRVMLVDGTSFPAPHVGTSSLLAVPESSQATWDLLLQSPELPLPGAFLKHVPSVSVGDGTVMWVGAQKRRQNLPVHHLRAFIEQYVHHVDHVVIDVGQPQRAATLRADRNILVTSMSNQADAACHYLSEEDTKWDLLLNGAPAAGWTPDRFAQLARQEVAGRLKQLPFHRHTLAHLAARKDLPDLGHTQVRPKRSKPKPTPVAPPVASHGYWVPELPPRPLYAQMLFKLGVRRP